MTDDVRSAAERLRTAIGDGKPIPWENPVYHKPMSPPPRHWYVMDCEEVARQHLAETDRSEIAADKLLDRGWKPFGDMWIYGNEDASLRDLGHGHWLFRSMLAQGTAKTLGQLSTLLRLAKEVR